MAMKVYVAMVALLVIAVTVGVLLARKEES